MKTIIIPGKGFITVCPACNCLFCFEDEDIIKKELELSVIDSWVTCPECGRGKNISYMREIVR